MDKIWALLGHRTRSIEPANARIHQSVKDRMAVDPSYEIGADLSSMRWEDSGWQHPHPDAP